MKAKQNSSILPKFFRNLYISWIVLTIVFTALSKLMTWISNQQEEEEGNIQKITKFLQNGLSHMMNSVLFMFFCVFILFNIDKLFYNLQTTTLDRIYSLLTWTFLLKIIYSFTVFVNSILYFVLGITNSIFLFLFGN